MDDNFMQYVMEIKRLQEENFQAAHKDINIPPQASSMNPSMAIMTDEITEENDDGGVSVTMDAINEETPFLPSWRVYWGAKTSSKGAADETSGTTKYGWKIWNPKVIYSGSELEVVNGDELLDESKDKDSQGTWYVGIFSSSSTSSTSTDTSSSETTSNTSTDTSSSDTSASETTDSETTSSGATTYAKVVHSSDDETMGKAKILVPLCKIKQNGMGITQYHVGVIIIGSSSGLASCFDVSADRKKYLNPYYRVEQYIFTMSEGNNSTSITIPIQKGLHVIKIDNESGVATIDVMDGIKKRLTDQSVDYMYSYIPLYMVEIGKNENGNDYITSMIDFRNIPTAQALLAVATI